MKIRYISFVCLIILYPTTYAGNSFWNNCKSYFANKGNDFPICFKDASPYWQKIGAKAQERVGIVNPVMIKQYPGENSLVAYVQDNTIFISANYFDSKEISYSAKSLALHHEAIHIKRNHLLKQWIWEICGDGAVGLAWLLSCYKGSSYIHNSYVAFAMGLSIGCALIARKFARKFVRETVRRAHEFEADCWGARATGCHICVKDHSGEIAEISNDDDYFKEGYATKQDLEKIAKKLKQQNQVCDYHRNGGLPK